MKIVRKNHLSNYIILEGGRRGMLPEVKEVKEFSKIIAKKMKEQFGMNFKFLVTWGASLGGILMPLNTYLETGGFNLSESEILLIVIGVGSIIFFENDAKIKKVLKLIEEKGLLEIFSQSLRKAEKLRDTFISFIESLNVTVQTLTNILSYAFLIPILPMILEMVGSGISEQDLKSLLSRFSYSISIAISGVALKEIVEKIIKRFRR